MTELLLLYLIFCFNLLILACCLVCFQQSFVGWAVSMVSSEQLQTIKKFNRHSALSFDNTDLWSCDVIQHTQKISISPQRHGIASVWNLQKMNIYIDHGYSCYVDHIKSKGVWWSAHKLSYSPDLGPFPRCELELAAIKCYYWIAVKQKVVQLQATNSILTSFFLF